MTDRYLSRAESAEYLKNRGLPTAKTTLQKYATTGGGPVYRRFGNRAVYTADDLNNWIEEKLSPPLSSSVEG
jgi:hypothetical protein